MRSRPISRQKGYEQLIRGLPNWDRMLTNVASRSLEATVLGKKLVALLLLAPVGVLSIVHRQAELAVAWAAAALGVPMLLSTLSSHSIEEVANVMGPAPR